MRRIVSPLLVGLGVFMLVLAVLVRAYAYPALAVVSANQDSVTRISGTDVEVFNIALLEPVTTDLYTSSATRAQESEDVPEGCVTWANTTSTRTGDPQGVVFQRSTELSTFDETSGAACEGGPDFVESAEGERESVQREGQIYKMPFATEKKDYLWWDGTVREASTMAYVGTDEIDGLEVYEFEQVIEPTVVQTRGLPGSIFDLDEPSVDAEVVYAMTRTLFVEPNTGVVVNRIEQREQVFRVDDIEVPAFVGTVAYTEETIEETIGEYETKAMLLSGARLLYPVLLGLLGLVLVVVGVLLGRRNRDDQAGRPARRQDLVDA